MGVTAWVLEEQPGISCNATLRKTAIILRISSFDPGFQRCMERLNYPLWRMDTPQTGGFGLSGVDHRKQGAARTRPKSNYAPVPQGLRAGSNKSFCSASVRGRAPSRAPLDTKQDHRYDPQRMASAYEFTPSPEKIPATQSAPSGGPPQPPPKPPKLTARDLLEPAAPGRRIFLCEYIEVKELAELLGLKPFKVVADVLELGIFKHAEEFIDFPTAATIAQKHGFVAEKLL